MDNGEVYTPNAGTLMDLNTGVEYDFIRESGTNTWNVKVHSIVTYTASNGKAVSVTLYKRHRIGVVPHYNA